MWLNKLTPYTVQTMRYLPSLRFLAIWIPVSGMTLLSFAPLICELDILVSSPLVGLFISFTQLSYGRSFLLLFFLKKEILIIYYLDVL